jgi:hypothetical protein
VRVGPGAGAQDHHPAGDAVLDELVELVEPELAEDDLRTSMLA